MRLFADKLAQHLEHNLTPIYLIMGNEPLLRLESQDAIVQAAKAKQFDERHSFSLEKIDWNLVHDACQALSLFSARQIIELEIPESGVNAANSKELVKLASQLHGDILLIVNAPKLNRAQENTAWFKALHAQGVLISCNTPDLRQLPQFVQFRCRALGLAPDQESLQLLAQWHEGNLLALAQSLQKLVLLYPDGKLTIPRLEAALSRHNHFTPFQWMDALLAGQAKRAQRILRQLHAEDQEIVILLRTLQKELFLIHEMQQKSLSMPVGKVFDQYHIWQNKRPFYTDTLQRITPLHLNQLIHQLAQLELMVKTSYTDDPWLALASFSMDFCQPK